MGRHQHNGNVLRRGLAFQLLTHQSAIHAREEDVQENQIRLEAEKVLQVASFLYRFSEVAFLFQNELQDTQDIRFIVNHKDAFPGHSPTSIPYRPAPVESHQASLMERNNTPGVPVSAGLLTSI